MVSKFMRQDQRIVDMDDFQLIDILLKIIIVILLTGYLNGITLKNKNNILFKIRDYINDQNIYSKYFFKFQFLQLYLMNTEFKKIHINNKNKLSETNKIQMTKKTKFFMLTKLEKY